jgi:hypothetical protein
MADTRDEPVTPTVGAADGPWVELRIHGVSGTPPESMLESAHVRQVAGDAWGRFFRPVNGVGEEQQTVGGRTLEGYHWGKYTSGSALQGLWLILIPFGLVNAAAFMVPDPGTTSRLTRQLHGWVQALIRAIGVGVSGTFALAAALILVDLLAGQWATGLPWLVGVRTGAVMTVGLALAALVVFALFHLGNQNRASAFDPAGPGSLAATDGSRGLERESFFVVRARSQPILGLLHLAAGWCVLSLIGALTWQTIHGSDDRAALFQTVRWTSIGLLLLIIGVVMVLGDPQQAVATTRLHKTWHRTVLPALTPVLVGAALGSLIASGTLLTMGDQRASHLDFDRYARILAASTGAAMILLFALNLALALRTVQPAGDPRPFRRFAAGLAPWAATSTGVFLGVGFCAAFVLGVARALGENAQTDLIYRVAYSWGLTVGLLVALGIFFGALWWRGGRTARQEVTAGYARVSAPDGLPGSWVKTVSGAMSAARLKLDIAVIFLSFAIAGLAMTIVTSLEMFGVHTWWWVAWLSHGSPSLTPHPAAQEAGAFAFLSRLGSYALLGLAGLLFYLGRRALRAEQTRRGANVIWDVVSFWPHSAHPFVPPAYSQFAVHDLRRRIRFHLGLPPTPVAGEPDPEPGPDSPRVVLSAHSQGSLLAFATVLWLRPGELARVGLVTYGSQLQVAFPRGFPAYVDFELLHRVKQLLGHRWVNLYRATDPIAGPVLSWRRQPDTGADPTSYRMDDGGPLIDHFHGPTGRRESGDDWRVLDPAAVDPGLQSSTLTHLSKHSNYPASPDYPDAVARVLT